MTFASDSAIVDIQRGQKLIAAHLEGRPTLCECPAQYRVPVVIYGYIDDEYSDDEDGNQSFTVVVEKIEVSLP